MDNKEEIAEILNILREIRDYLKPSVQIESVYDRNEGIERLLMSLEEDV